MELLILSGSFTSLSLWLLALTLPSPIANPPSEASLRLLRSIPAFGPHQYLHLSPSKDAVYATTWSLPPMLHAFSLPKLEHLGAAPITATSSYITIRGKWMYSAGGPTGEVHRLPFPEPVKEQQFLFVSEDELETADKTRDDVATRAYVPVLGTDKVHIYLVDPATGLLSEEKVLKTPEGSGPRHLKLHPNGQVLYVVTEHDNTLLTYSLPSLELLSTHTLYPPATSSSSPKAPADQASYRGDTLMLSPSATTLFTTTRGATPATRGWLAAFPLTSSEITYWLTPTSGGKANAIDVMLYPGERTNRGSFSVVASITDSEIGGTSHAVFIPGLGTDGDAAEGRHDEL
ncbi:Lactonase, 7-bladed beta-propeller-domain-containing protein [Mucidula mucida]|nr:Lactonase, 7-bladed beta-propeller-domain-containing protein [Mucidula mucida]